MRAAFIEKPYDMKFINTPEPVIEKPDDIKIMIKFTGICGSEIHAYKGTHPTRLPPIISGHESSGIITEVGKAVKKFKPGDRVIVIPQKSCGICKDCIRGDENLCSEKAVLGTIKWQGSFGEYIIAPERTVLNIPDNISLEEGALAEPLSVAAHAVRISNVHLGTTVFIQGCGPIGIAILAMCRFAGAEKIIMSDISQYNMDIAKQIGANVVIYAKNQNIIDEISAITSGEGAEVVFIAVGNSETLNEAVQCTKNHGQIIEVAHFGNKDTPFNIKNFRWKEVSLLGSFMFVNKDFEIAMDALTNGKINVKPMISKIIPIEDCAAVMKMAYERSENFVKILFKF
ncbi:MAG: alcohol dehydrogenase catalytic domain-containing protein [Treponema sp.]|jgi:L-iditol 2-dehydrogenase|nr:alcohol dehydrogenase catalytic domain-containing protein [Treponema sp.]